MGILDARAAMLLPWLEQQHRLISPREQVDAGISDEWTLAEAVSQWGQEGKSQLARKLSGKDAEMLGCQEQHEEEDLPCESSELPQ